MRYDQAQKLLESITSECHVTLPKPLADMSAKANAALQALADVRDPKAIDYFAESDAQNMAGAVADFTTAVSSTNARREAHKAFKNTAEREFLGVLGQQWSDLYDRIAAKLSERTADLNKLAGQVPQALASNPARSGDFGLEHVQALHGLEGAVRQTTPVVDALVILQPAEFPGRWRNSYDYAKFLPLLQLIDPAGVDLPYAFERGRLGWNPSVIVGLVARGLPIDPQPFEDVHQGVLAKLEAQKDWEYRPDRPEGQRWTYHNPEPPESPFPAGHTPDEHELRQLEYGRVAAR